MEQKVFDILIIFRFPLTITRSPTGLSSLLLKKVFTKY